MSDPSTQEWHHHLARAIAGDRDAHEVLYNEFNARLRYYIGRFTTDDDLRDEILQQVWVCVFLDLKKLRQPEKFKSWLYRVAHNRSMRVLKLERRRWFRFPVTIEEMPLEPVDDKVDEFDEVDLRLLHEGLLAIPTDQREVLVLKFIEDFSYGEIAKVVGVSEGTIGSRLHYGKQALRAYITAEKKKLND